MGRSDLGELLRALEAMLSPRLLAVIPPAHLLHAYASVHRLGPAEMREQCMRFPLPSGLGVFRNDTFPLRSTRTLSTAQAERVLGLYFWQVLGQAPVFLDMRARALLGVEDPLLWRPLPLVAHWSLEFRAACRDMYEGHFLDQPSRFSAGARGLGLGHAESELRAQFGDTRAVLFSAASFVKRSTAVLRRSMDAGAAIHPDFVSLSLLLASMYQRLSGVRQPLDVRAAFERTLPLVLQARDPAEVAQLV